MAKQLRLDVAQLTDIGRKRPHNEDNMAYVIPKDVQVMASKGALFIVADGMGGHAAGEVASEIAVDTVSNVYYQDDSPDVATSLLHAIRRANAAIHQRAAENLLRTGMGTTCVAAVMRGNLAYIANVGDSRAYFIRNNQIRLVSQDHSWVAEQVRAGLLTEDQARTHGQRNVITRSLGTQPDVDVDVFCEQLQEGDIMLLCSDGLSGFVGDNELLRIVEQFLPQESVYHLVERANESGGPDNITAIVARVLEAGAEQPNGRYPVHVGGREDGEDTLSLGTLPAAPMTYQARNGELRTPSSPLPLSHDLLTVPESTSSPQLVSSTPPQRNRRLLSLSLMVLVLLLIVGSGGGVSYYLRQAENQTVQQALDYAQGQITQANAQTSTAPATALASLSNAQRRLHDIQTRHQLNESQTMHVASLQQQLTTEARVAIASYNTAAAIELLPCANTLLNTVNGGSTNTIAKSIAAVQTPKMTSLLYSLGGDGTLYRLNQDGTQYTLVNGFALPKGAQLTTIAGNGRFLLALASQGTRPPTYSLNVFPPPDLSGKLGTPSTVTIPAELIKDGKTPTFLTAWGPSVSVILSSSTDPRNAVVLSYTLDLRNNHVVGTVGRTSIAISEDIVSVAAFPKQLFLLLADGSVSSLQLVGKNPAPVPVQVTPPIATPLAGGDQPFSATMNVPTGTTNVSTPTTGQGAATFLSVPGASLLTAGQVNSIPHLYIVHPVTHRVIDLQPPKTSGATPSPPSTSTVAETSPTLQFVQQYVSSSSLSQVKSLAVDPLGVHLFILVQNNSTLWNIVSTSTGPQSGCKP